jgi:uncharacterized protein YbjT (DUF2867 family)
LSLLAQRSSELGIKSRSFNAGVSKEEIMTITSTNTVLITGATGNTGSVLLRLLEQRGVTVRATVRHRRDVVRLGNTSASLVIADFDDADSIAAALEGVDSAYLVTPSSSDAEAQQIRFAELAAAANVKHLVKLSQLAADEASPVRFLRYHAVVERRIRELGIDYTFLRPNLYFQGFLAFQALIANDGRFFAPIGDARVSAVDVRDIALVAAAALTQPGHIGKTYTITGPAAVTHAEIAHAIAEAIGRQVTFVDVPPEVFSDALIRFGVPPWQVDGLVEDYAHYARGEASEVHPTVREITGTEPRDVMTFARDYAGAFNP